MALFPLKFKGMLHRMLLTPDFPVEVLSCHIPCWYSTQIYPSSASHPATCVSPWEAVSHLTSWHSWVIEAGSKAQVHNLRDHSSGRLLIEAQFRVWDSSHFHLAQQNCLKHCCASFDSHSAEDSPASISNELWLPSSSKQQLLSWYHIPTWTSQYLG